MKNKYLLAIIPILLGVICLSIHASTISMQSNGLVVEPYFFLVPISFVLFLTGIISLLVLIIITIFKKRNLN